MYRKTEMFIDIYAHAYGKIVKLLERVDGSVNGMIMLDVHLGKRW